MKHATLQKITAGALLFILSGAFVACLTFGARSATMSSSHTSHTSQSTRDIAVGHIEHAKSLSISSISPLFSFEIALFLALLSSGLWFVAVSLATEPARLLKAFPSRARKRFTLSKYERGLVAFLIRFVRSPEFA